jgi:putative transposase
MHLPHVRPFADEQLVFLTCCTRGRRPVLANNDAHAVLRLIWSEAAPRNGWFVGKYLLMPDHVHLFTCPTKEAPSLARWVGLWKSLSARRLQRAIDCREGLWQEDYFDRFLRSAESYDEKWEYVRMNPIRRGLVPKPEDWPFQGIIHDLAF